MSMLVRIVALLVASITCIGVTACTTTSRQAPSGSPSSLENLSRTTIELGRRASAIELDGERIWVASPAEDDQNYGVLLSANRRNGVVERSTKIGWSPSDLAVGFGGVWVANGIGDGSRKGPYENSVTRIDSRTGSARIISVQAPEAVAASSQFVWVASSGTSTSTIVAINPKTYSAQRSVPILGSGPISLVSLKQGVIALTTSYASNGSSIIVQTIDDSFRVAKKFELPNASGGRASASGDSLWISHLNTQASGTVVNVSLSSWRIRQRYSLDLSSIGIAATRRHIWMTTADGVLLDVSPATGAIVREERIGMSGGCVAADDGVVVVCLPESAQLASFNT